MRFWRAAAIAAAVLSAATASAETLNATSANGYDFGDMGESPLEITGALEGPAPGAARGVVILSHGSSGRSRRQRAWAQFLHARGWATLALDHFGPRGATSTVRAQLSVTEQQMAADVVAAAAEARARFGAAPVIHAGWSKGASAGLLAAVDRFAALIGAPQDVTPLDGALAFYPFCGVSLSGETSAAQLLILHGTDDDWTPIEPCRDAVAALAASGSDAEMFEVAGGLHGFDAWGAPRRTIARAITVRDGSDACRLVVGPEGETRTIDGAFGVGGFVSRSAYLLRCGERGVTAGGSADAQTETEARVAAFLEAVVEAVAR